MSPPFAGACLLPVALPLPPQAAEDLYGQVESGSSLHSHGVEQAERDDAVGVLVGPQSPLLTLDLSQVARGVAARGSGLSAGLLVMHYYHLLLQSILLRSTR